MDKDALNELPYRMKNPGNRYYPIDDPRFERDKTGLSTQWKATAASDKIATVSRLVAADHSLTAAWAVLKNAIDTSNPTIAAAYRDVEASTADVSTATRTMVRTEYFNYEHGPGSVTADQFFDVVEITERVLLELSISDMLTMMEVDKRMCESIEGSQKLQKHLHLQADDGAIFRSLDFRPRLKDYWRTNRSHLPNLDIKTEEGRHSKYYARCTDRPTIKIKFGPAVYRSLMNPGSRIMDMTISQPPVTEMDVSVNCCDDSSVTVGYGYVGLGYDDEDFEFPARPQSEAEFVKVANEDGITVADLYYACWDTAEQHHLCPRARHEDLDAYGHVWPTFRFEGVAPPDCEVPDRDRERLQGPMTSPRVRDIERDGEERVWREKMMHYTEAKRAANDEGQPVPTLEEFQAYPSLKDFLVAKALGHEYLYEQREDHGWGYDDY